MTAPLSSARWSDASVPRPHGDIETVFAAPEAVLIDARTGEVTQLNPSASLVWLFLAPDASVADIVRELGDVTNAPASQLREDVLGILDDFGQRGLLELSTPPDEAPSAARSADVEVIARPPDP